MSRGQANLMLGSALLAFFFSLLAFIRGNQAVDLLRKQQLAAAPASATATAMAVVRGTVLEPNGAAIAEVTIWLYRDTGGGYKLINVKLIEENGSFAFYISPVRGTYKVDIDLPGGYVAVGPESYTFTLDTNRLWEFQAERVTLTATPTQTMIPTETRTPLPSFTPPMPPTPTPSPCPPSPTPPGEATLDIPAAARWLIAQAVYDSYYWGEKVDPYDDFMDSPFWGWSQERQQLGLPLSKTVSVTVNEKTYLAVGFLCEILAYEEKDPTRFAVVDYGGRQVNRP